MSITPKNKCNFCNHDDKQENIVFCVNCKLPYHAVCVGLTTDEVEVLRLSRCRLVFHCKPCSEQSKKIKEEMRSLINGLKEDIEKFKSCQVSRNKCLCEIQDLAQTTLNLVTDDINGPDSKYTANLNEASVTNSVNNNKKSDNFCANKLNSVDKLESGCDSDVDCNNGLPKKYSKRASGVYRKVRSLTPELANIVGQDRMARHEVRNKIWSIIDEKNLYDPKNKQYAICDDDLMKVIGVRRFRVFETMKYLKKHFID